MHSVLAGRKRILYIYPENNSLRYFLLHLFGMQNGLRNNILYLRVQLQLVINCELNEIP